MRRLRRAAGMAAGRMIYLLNEIRYGEKALARRDIQLAAANYDMAAKPDEPYYVQQYLHWILPALEERFPRKNIRILDLGCGQGRLTLPLAAWDRDGKVTGVDFTGEVIEAARKYSNENKIANTEWSVDEALHFLEGSAPGSFECVVFTEVIYMLEEYGKALQHVHRILKPGGLAFISFRSRYYNLLHTVRGRNFAGARLAASQQAGKLFGGAVSFSWHGTRDIIGLMNGVGFKNVTCRGIGVLSGIEGDPLAGIARPSLLDASDRKALFELEVGLAETYADCGRYILARGEK